MFTHRSPNFDPNLDIQPERAQDLTMRRTNSFDRVQESVRQTDRASGQSLRVLVAAGNPSHGATEYRRNGASSPWGEPFERARRFEGGLIWREGK